MTVYVNDNCNGIVKDVEVITSVGEKYRLKEDIFGGLDITKISDDPLQINPRVSNQISVK